MSNHKVYRIKLTTEERDAFTQVAKGKRGQLKIAAWKVQRANAMLMCDEGDKGPGWTDEKIAEAFGTTTRSLENWRKQAALQGPLSLLERNQRAMPPTPSDAIKKNQLKPWLKSMWCIPPEQDSAFVAAMEQVLTVYHRPYDSRWFATI